MFRFVHLCVLLITVWFVGCVPSNAPTPARKRPSPPSAELRDVLAPYEMDAVQKKHFLATIKTLHPGQSREAVVALLGPPYSERKIQAKGPRAPVRGILLNYYITKAAGAGNEGDSHVSFIFDNDNKLIRLSVQNIDGLSEQITKLPVREFWWDDNLKRTVEIEKKKKKE